MGVGVYIRFGYCFFKMVEKVVCVNGNVGCGYVGGNIWVVVKRYDFYFLFEVEDEVCFFDLVFIRVIIVLSCFWFKVEIMDEDEIVGC